MKRTAFIRNLLPLLLVIFLAGCEQGNSATAEKSQAQSATKVNVVTLTAQHVTVTRTLPARTVAYRKAEVRPQVSGIIEKRFFKEGSDVKAGDPLYQIDPASYQATLSNAQAGLAKAQATMLTAQAKQKRYKNLLTDHAISQQDYDDALAAYQEAEAEIKVQQAAVKLAKINLAYTKVYAPISGHISKSNVTEGALVTAQQADVLTTIYQLDPIYVDITQPSKQLLRLRKRMIDRQVAEDKAPTVQLTLEDDSVYPIKGKLQFAEVNVDPTTGDVELRAIMPNPQQLLLPGMFVRAIVVEAEENNAILVPQAAVSFDKEGNATALVVNKDSKAEVRQLVVDTSIRGDWLLRSGLKAGDKVIVDGVQKVKPGATVKVDKDTMQVAKNGD